MWYFMKKIFLVITIFLLNIDFVKALEVYYKCSSVNFGEQVPIQLASIPWENQKQCGSLCEKTQIKRYPNLKDYLAEPINGINLLNTKNFNQPLLNFEYKDSYAILHPIKRFIFVDEGLDSIKILQTRYVDYPHLDFKFKLSCDEAKNCSADFEVPAISKNPNLKIFLEDGVGFGGKKIKKLVFEILSPMLMDKREGVKKVRAELSFVGKEFPRLVGRIFKENLMFFENTLLPLSSSAELDFSSLPGSVELDWAVDEPINIGKNKSDEQIFQRIEASEFKFKCDKL